VPRSLGGAELDLPTYIQVVEELGKADASTGWCVNQGAIFATYSARMPPDAARAIWIDPPRAVVANTPVASAQAIPVPGGYRVTGRQGFSTGCRHASWMAAHAQIIEGGQPRLEDGQLETRYMFVPVAEARLLDTWQVRGMRGTGTHHFAVEDVFVPEARTVRSVTAPLVETGPLYQIPRTLLFASGDAAVALGLARTCLATFYDLAGAKVPRAMPGLLRELPMVQADVGRAEADLRAGRAFLTEAVGEVWEAACAGEPAHRHHPRHPPGRGDRRHRLQRRRRDGRLREPPPAAALPGRPRHQPAHAVAPGQLRAGGAPLAGPEDRRSETLETRR
jgi:alkylation response protein AidB-like acyl-CoA dehydrogenase